MGGELKELTLEIMKILKWFVVPISVLRLGYAFIRYVAGYRKELSMAIRQVFLGIIGIECISLIVWMGIRIGNSIPQFDIFVHMS